MRPLVYDFGQLNPETEKDYAKQIVFDHVSDPFAAVMVLSCVVVVLSCVVVVLSCVVCCRSAVMCCVLS